MVSTDVSYVLSFEEAAGIMRSAEEAFGQADVARILSGYTLDIIIRFADLPEIQGIEAAEAFLKARFNRQKKYRLRKTLRTVMNNIIGGTWEGTWEDAKTGKQMKGRGSEFLTMRDGKVAEWDATFNTCEVGGAPVTPLL